MHDKQRCGAANVLYLSERRGVGARFDRWLRRHGFEGGVATPDGVAGLVERLREEDGGHVAVVDRQSHDFPLSEVVYYLQAAEPAVPFVIIEDDGWELDYTLAGELGAVGVAAASDGPAIAFFVAQALRRAEEWRRQMETVDLFMAHAMVGEERPPRRERPPKVLHALQRALESDGFTLYFQPIIPISRRAEAEGLEQYEVLLRLPDPSGEVGGYLRPDEFLPVAAQFGQMPAIDRWVVEQVVKRLEAEARCNRALRLFVNVSGHTLADPVVLDALVDPQFLGRTPPGSLCIENDRYSLMRYAASARRFRDASRDGRILFCVDEPELGDDLAPEDMRVDYYKLDSALTQGIADNHGSQSKIRAVVARAKRLGMRVMAAGIEDSADLRAVYDAGVDFVQGYAVSAPQPSMEHPIEEVHQEGVVRAF